jgi:hypothetical protein
MGQFIVRSGLFPGYGTMDRIAIDCLSLIHSCSARLAGSVDWIWVCRGLSLEVFLWFTNGSDSRESAVRRSGRHQVVVLQLTVVGSGGKAPRSKYCQRHEMFPKGSSLGLAVRIDGS